ncbi:hypothetical protein HHK36_031371 [Tetracentron sinense]|uniref:Sugar phosphate transporter domain-containing protein n=1 Tax=Tetracentron sinense TaxID=13715 RepID=A0A835CZI1_TETSI|nr:hypothetical protein HHK36_031371 [Tetracentron sinense]
MVRTLTTTGSNDGAMAGDDGMRLWRRRSETGTMVRKKRVEEESYTVRYIGKLRQKAATLVGDCFFDRSNIDLKIDLFFASFAEAPLAQFYFKSGSENMENDKKSSSVSDMGAWAMNVISSVGIIMANKQLMSPNGYAFSFATTLTGFHFAVTALVGLVSNATGYSAPKHVPLWELLWFSVVANMSITGMNLSLMLNSVGFYQISKLSMIPVVCVMEWILHSKHYSREVKIAVVVVVVGVGVCTVTDVKVNAKGFLCACVAILSTSLQQIVSFFLNSLLLISHYYKEFLSRLISI